MGIYKADGFWWIDGYDETGEYYKIGPFGTKKEAKEYKKQLDVNGNIIK